MKNSKGWLFIVLIFLGAACNQSLKVGGSSDHVEKITEKGILLQDGTFFDFPEVEEANVIFLIRHAEKEETSEGNPGLTEQGEERAKVLEDLMGGVALDKVFSTDFLRTTSTASPCATQQGLELDYYHHRKLKAFIKEELKNGKGKKMLVVGHGNTTPAILNLLIDNEVYNAIPKYEFDHFYVVCLKEEKILDIKSYKYF